jgi:excisionase family DNA binding protein
MNTDTPLPALLAQLAEGLAALVASLATPPVVAASPIHEPDKMLTVAEVAERLRCSSKSIYRRASSFPFARRNGRTWLFSEQGLTKWLARQRG